MVSVLLAAACTPPDHQPLRLTFEVSEVVPSVLVGTLTGAHQATAELVDVDGAVRPVALRSVGPHVELRLVGLPAGEPFTVRVSDGPRTLEVVGSAPLAEGLPTFVVDVDEAAPELVLVALTDDRDSMIAAIDGRGRYRWWWPTTPERTVAAPRVSLDGTALVASSQDRERSDVDQLVHTVAFDGSGRVDTALVGAHHMVAELPDGGFVWPSWEVRSIPWPDTVWPVMADRILRQAPGGEVVQLHSWHDDEPDAEPPCDHAFRRVNRLGSPVYEWTHVNSVVHEPETDAVLVNARLPDSILALDRETGDVRWQLGGAGATIPFERPADAFSHAHFSEADADHLLVFDNGTHHDPPSSRVIEYALPDEPGGSAVVTREVPLELYVEILGDARWRPDGGLLVAASDPGALRVYDATDRVTWQVRIEDGTVLGRIRELPPPW